jgi:hypothetical protein
METEVLTEIAPKLAQVKEMYIEFHGNSTNPDNQLNKIVAILDQNKFEYTLKEFGQLITLDQVSKDDPQWLIIHAFRKTQSL